jgi:hypothetical protein
VAACGDRVADRLSVAHQFDTDSRRRSNSGSDGVFGRDNGALVRNGSIKLVKPLAELKIPPTVQAILASRID